MQYRFCLDVYVNELGTLEGIYTLSLFMFCDSQINAYRFKAVLLCVRKIWPDYQSEK